MESLEPFKMPSAMTPEFFLLHPDCSISKVHRKRPKCSGKHYHKPTRGDLHHQWLTLTLKPPRRKSDPSQVDQRHGR